MFNIFKFIIVSLVFASLYSIPYSGVLLTAVIGFLATVYYSIVFLALTGILQGTVDINSGDDLKNSAVTVLSNVTGVITVFVTTPYDFVALLAAPWVTISTFTLVFSSLVYYGVLEIGQIDDQEDDDEENRD